MLRYKPKTDFPFGTLKFIFSSLLLNMLVLSPLTPANLKQMWLNGCKSTGEKKYFPVSSCSSSSNFFSCVFPVAQPHNFGPAGSPPLSEPQSSPKLCSLRMWLYNETRASQARGAISSVFLPPFPFHSPFPSHPLLKGKGKEKRDKVGRWGLGGLRQLKKGQEGRSEGAAEAGGDVMRGERQVTR